MKTLTRVVLPLFGLVGLIFGIAYITQYTSKSKPVDANPVLPDSESRIEADPLRFNHYQAMWDPDDPEAVADVEIGTQGHYDFWFYNPRTDNVVLGVKEKSCTCASIALGTIPDAAWLQWIQQRALAGFVAPTGAALLGPIAGLALHQAIQWDVMGTGEGSRREVPPPSTPGKPGVLRIAWDAKERQEPVIRLYVEMLQQLGQAQATRRFEARYSVVPVIAVAPLQIELGEIPPGGKREVECFALTTTRDHLDLNLKIGPDSADATNPCFSISQPVALTAAECAALPTSLGSPFTKMKIRSGFRFVVTVFESRAGRQLDLGPVSRRLDVTVAGAGRAASVPVQGLVRGDVEVSGVDPQGRVALGSFRADRGTSHSVVLSTARSDFDLAIDHVTDAAIKASIAQEIEGGSKKRWRLSIDIPAFSVAGPIPSTTAVILTTKGKDSRALRVPISGNAFR